MAATATTTEEEEADSAMNTMRTGGTLTTPPTERTEAAVAVMHQQGPGKRQEPETRKARIERKTTRRGIRMDWRERSWKKK